MIMDLEKKFEEYARRVYNQFKSPMQSATDEAKMLWLAWRGNEDYLICCLGKETGKESVWRVIHYSMIPDLCEKYNHIEVRSLNESFADYILAFISRFLTAESDKLGGAETVIQMAPSLEHGRGQTVAIDQRELFAHISKGEEVSVRWHSQKAPTLFSKVISLSPSTFRCLKYPKLDAPMKTLRISNNFMRFFKRDESSSRRRRRRSLTRWVMFG